MRLRWKILAVLACLWLICVPTGLQAQTAPAPTASPSLAPGPKPADAPIEWKLLVGIYGQIKESSIIILERDLQLFWVASKKTPVTASLEENGDLFLHNSDTRSAKVFIQRDASGVITALNFNHLKYRRADAGADPAHCYHVTPARPLEDLRTEALRESPPKETGPSREPDLVELTTLDGGIPPRHPVCAIQQFPEYAGVHTRARISAAARSGSAGARAE